MPLTWGSWGTRVELPMMGREKSTGCGVEATVHVGRK